jgi:phosphatidylglycerophosphatase A
MSDSVPRADRTGSQNLPFLTRCIATGFFSGYIPWASGTFGALVGLLLCLLPYVHLPSVLIPCIVAGFAVGVYTSGEVARAEGDRLSRTAAAAKAAFQPGERQHADPSIVVIDEMVGMWVSLLWLTPSVASYVLAFVAFRIFDVLKPAPVRQLERLPGGWGIMLDDVIAGIYANVIVQALLFLLSKLPGTISI